MLNKTSLSLAFLSCFALSACGGGNSGKGNSSTDDTTGNGNTSVTLAPVAPLLSDNVLVSNSLAENGLFMTVNASGIVRAFGIGNTQNFRLAAGTTPLSQIGNTVSGGAWLASGNTYEPGTVTASANADGTTYTLGAQSADAQVSAPNMEPLVTLIAPTPAALSGQYGIASSWAVTIDGSTLNGTYGNTCTWSATLSPNARTIDVSNITFQTAGMPLNPDGVACTYAGKVYTGTAFLTGPSQAYPKGAFDIIFDDSASSSVPTTLQMYNFIKQ